MMSTPFSAAIDRAHGPAATFSEDAHVWSTWRLTAPARQIAESALTRAGITVTAAAFATTNARFAMVGCKLGPAWHRPIVHAAAIRGASGVAIGTWIYVKDAQALSRWTLLVHELVHVAQFREIGTWRFLARYVSRYARGRLSGLSDMDAYRAIDFEQQARAAERDICEPSRPYVEQDERTHPAR